MLNKKKIATGNRNSHTTQALLRHYLTLIADIGRQHSDLYLSFVLVRLVLSGAGDMKTGVGSRLLRESVS